MEKVEDEEEQQLKGENAGGKKRGENLPSFSLRRGGLTVVVVLNTPVTAATIEIWEEEEGKRRVRGGSTALCNGLSNDEWSKRDGSRTDGWLKSLHSSGSKELIASIILFNGKLLIGDQWRVDLMEVTSTHNGDTSTAVVLTEF